MKRLLMHAGMIVVLASGSLSSLPALAAPEQKYVVEPVAQKKIKELPAGPLYWRVETFPYADRRQGRGRPRRLEPCFGTV